MRRLILMRHGKSSWDDPDQDDRDRPLNPRGRMASALMGAWLRENGLAPDVALVSEAVRARQTWECAAPLLNGVESRAVAKLYHAEPGTALEVLRNAPDDAGTVLMIGHQPGLGAFLRKLVGNEPKAGCRRAFEKFPTGAVAVLEFDAPDWRSAEFGTAEFTAFACPKDLV